MVANGASFLNQMVGDIKSRLATCACDLSEREAADRAHISAQLKIAPDRKLFGGGGGGGVCC